MGGLHAMLRTYLSTPRTSLFGEEYMFFGDGAEGGCGARLVTKCAWIPSAGNAERDHDVPGMYSTEC